MKVSIRNAVLGAFAAAAGAMGVAQAAPVTFGGETLDVSAYADRVALVSGSSEIIITDGLSGGNANRAVGREGPNLDVVKCRDAVGCTFDIFFDGGVMNQDGNDIVLYGMGTMADDLEVFDLIVNDVVLSSAHLTSTGIIVGTDIRPQGYDLKALRIDLSDFGVAVGQVIESIRIAVNPNFNSEEFIAFASLNDDVQSMPVPAGAFLFIPGLLGLARVSRKKKKSA